MTSFAERIGKRPLRSLTQRESLDGDTRTALWNVLHEVRNILRKADSETYRSDSIETNVLGAVWVSIYRLPRDELTSETHVWKMIKASILEAEWFDVLDLIERIVDYVSFFGTHETATLVPAMTGAFNDRFEQYLVGYRFVGEVITPVDSEIESAAVSGAAMDSVGISGAQHALERAVQLLSDRRQPDYPNSVKESISAVEAVVKKLTGEGTLGAGLGKLEAAGLVIHPAQRGAWSKMYGWTSDADGIRHAGIEAADTDQATAKYVLVVCAAFVSFLIEEGRKLELIESE